MRKYLVLIAPVVVLLAAGGLVWLRAAPGDPPPVGAPTAIPNIITVGTPTPVVFIVSIPDPTLNPASVNLLRVAANGSSTVVAQMLDNGQNGDQKPGDKVFTARLTLNETTPAELKFQVSAAFKGIIRRSLSPTMSMAALAPHVLPVALPPDPGQAGKATIAGTDSDNDGVRDDVQRYIVLTYPSSETTRVGLTQAAQALQSALIDADNKAAAVTDAHTVYNAIECLSYTLASHARHTFMLLLQQQVNTDTRTRAYLQYSDQLGGSSFPLSADMRRSCGVDPGTLRN
jgi:hypothetical protein